MKTTSFRSPIGEPQLSLPQALPDPTRLPVPTRVDLTRINWAYAGTFLLLHGLALLALVPWFFSWVGLACFLTGAILFGQFAIPIGYHRLLSHRSFRTPKWFERFLATLALCAGQETPARWVAWHRVHHLHSDQHEDPHSPLVSFFWSHMNWLVHETYDGGRTFSIYEKHARDILKDPYYMWIEKLRFGSPIFFTAHALLILLVTASISSFIYGWNMQTAQLTASVLVWGVALRTVCVWHMTWSVNSLTHLFGYRNFNTPDRSRNNWLVALITSGEGWHNNHHADQAAATVQVRWWEFDLNYYVIKGFERIGLASHIVAPIGRRRSDSAAA